MANVYVDATEALVKRINQIGEGVINAMKTDKRITEDLTANVDVNKEEVQDAIKNVQNNVKRLKLPDIEVTDKPWGFETVIEKNDNYVIKQLHINKGERTSEQFHKEAVKTIIGVSGYGRVIKNGDHKAMYDQEKLAVDPYDIHRIEAHPQFDLKILVLATPHPQDKYRTNDDYGRV